MSKPVREVEVTTVEEASASVQALLDTGSFFTLIREDRLPAGTQVPRYRKPKVFGTAARGGTIEVIGAVHLGVNLEGHPIEVEALVVPALTSEMILGAGAMQMWDISIRNKNGATAVEVGRDLNDPEIQVVE